MARSSNRLPRRALVVVVVVLAALTASCSSSGSSSNPKDAATVGGKPITAAAVKVDLQSEIQLASALKTPVAAGVLASGTDKSPLRTADGKKFFAMTAADGKLKNLILDQLLIGELARLKATVTAADRTAAEADLCPNSPGCLDKYPAAIKKRQLDQQARLVAYTRVEPTAKVTTLTDAEILAQAQKQYDTALAADPKNLDQLCYTAAQFPDQASADSAKAQVDAGGDLATITAAVPGAQAGQGEQCQLTSVLSQNSAPAELLTATAGAVLEIPNTGSTGIIVVKVTQARQATFDQIKDDLVSALRQQEDSDNKSKAQTAVKAAITKVAKRVGVTVDPAYGTWDGTKLAVNPPKSVTTTTTAAAGGASTPDTSTATTTAPAGTAPTPNLNTTTTVP